MQREATQTMSNRFKPRKKRTQPKREPTQANAKPLANPLAEKLAKAKEGIHDEVMQKLSIEEQYDITHRPIIALTYARYLAETAYMYAWSERVEYTARASRPLREIIALDRPHGMDVTEWADFKPKAIANIENRLAKSLTPRLHLACKSAIQDQARGIDNTDLRAWALASITALDAMEMLEEHYGRIIRGRIVDLPSLRVKTDDRADDLRNIMRTYVGFDIHTPTLEAFAREITNDILSIKFISK